MENTFLLTKAPRAPRSELCFELMSRSEHPKLFLLGDGTYHLLNLAELKGVKVVACKDDAMARGLPVSDREMMPDDFYGLLVKEMMERSDHVYVF